MSRPDVEYTITTRLIYQAAIGLTATHFPRYATEASTVVSSREVAFMLDGHVDAWQAWPSLGETDTTQATDLLRLRKVEFADPESVERDLEQLLREDLLAGCELVGEDRTGLLIACTPGMPLPDFVAYTLNQLEKKSKVGRGLTRTATSGDYQTTLRIAAVKGSPSRVVDARYSIPVFPEPAEDRERIAEPPAVTTAPGIMQISVAVADLVELAAKIDALRDGRSDGYRARHVKRLCERLHTTTGLVSLSGLLELAAGELRLMNAPTGYGKSVLMEVLACWAALNQYVVTLVVPANADVLKLSHAIELDLQALDLGVSVTPLMSPASLVKALKNVVRNKPSWDPCGEWTLSKLGYGCALAAAASTESTVDAWQQGNEPCTSLQPVSADSHTDQRDERAKACPWRMTCGKFQLARAATTASIIVTSHTNLHTGRVHLPVRDERGVTDRMSIEELVFRRSDLIMIDEIDAFQADVLAQSARGLLLDQAGNTKTPLRKLDTECAAAVGRVHRDVDAAVHDLTLHARFLAETYVRGLVHGRIGPVGLQSKARRRGPGRLWIVPRRWDGWLTAKLFQLDEDQPFNAEMVAAFRSLFAGETSAPETEPAFFGQLREALHSVTAMGNGAGVIEASRATIDDTLAGIVTDEGERAQVADRLLRRALLERLRYNLRRLVFHVPQLGAAGVKTGQEIAETFGPYSRWRVTPNGPLGRLLFAFTEHVDPLDPRTTRLRAAAFGGDPHVYTSGLADITALCRAGTRRAVLGLSATAFFPRAPHHHVHVSPHWWVRDDDPVGVKILDGHLSHERRPPRVSGKQGRERIEALWTVAKLLWKQRLRMELDRLSREDPERARVLLATTSYDGARSVAEGLVSAGVEPVRICLAVRPERSIAIGESPGDVRGAADWHELAADRLEEFPDLEKADILIAPLARVQRGVNIIGSDDRSALGSIWLIVRPVPIIDEPTELMAHVNAHVLETDPADELFQNLADRLLPAEVLQARRDEAGHYFEQIVTSLPYFRAMPKSVQLAITAEIMNGIIQLVGRARRGGTPAALHLVDGAFMDPDGGPTFAELIHRLRAHWGQSGALPLMTELYGTTLKAFFAYADQQAALLSTS